MLHFYHITVVSHYYIPLLSDNTAELSYCSAEAITFVMGHYHNMITDNQVQMYLSNFVWSKNKKYLH